MPSQRDRFLDQLRGLLGPPPVAESPPGSNCTIVNRELGEPCEAWCCLTIRLMLRRVGLDILPTAGVLQAMNWARAGVRGMRWHPKGTSPQPGWAMLFDWKHRGRSADMHISTVEYLRSDGWRVTIGGNEHDRVMRQFRDEKFCMGYIEFPFTDAPPAPAPQPITTQEDEMIRIPAPTGGSIKDPEGKPCEFGAVPIRAGKGAVITAVSDGFPANGALVRIAIGSARKPPFRHKETIFVPGQRVSWDTVDGDEIAALTNYGPNAVTLAVEYAN